MTERVKPSESTVAELFDKCRRRCCMCYSLNRDNRLKQGQIAHIDRINTNSNIDNLVFLCLEHHDDYDTKRSQSKNYTPMELKKYKDELEKHIQEEWSKPIVGSDLKVDIFSGNYSHSRENSEANLTIKYIGGNLLQISGMSFYGTQREYGPNMGELDCIATIEDNKAIFKDKFHDGEEYIFEITFLGNKIAVEDNYIMGYYGNGVCFTGEYYKE
jgi:hypothetical protein